MKNSWVVGFYAREYEDGVFFEFYYLNLNVFQIVTFAQCGEITDKDYLYFFYRMEMIHASMWYLCLCQYNTYVEWS